MYDSCTLECCCGHWPMKGGDVVEDRGAVTPKPPKGTCLTTQFLRIKKLQFPTGIIDEEIMQVHPLHVSKDILMLQILREVFALTAQFLI